MMDLEKFEVIKKEYGTCSSWAIWKEVGETPKSNTGDLNILDPKKNTDQIYVSTVCNKQRLANDQRIPYRTRMTLGISQI